MTNVTKLSIIIKLIHQPKLSINLVLCLLVLSFRVEMTKLIKYAFGWWWACPARGSLDVKINTWTASEFLMKHYLQPPMTETAFLLRIPLYLKKFIYPFLFILKRDAFVTNKTFDVNGIWDIYRTLKIVFGEFKL